MNNILSIDLESWVHFYEDALKINKMSSSERKKLDGGYIVKSTMEILHSLEKHMTKATFFIVSEIYDWYPKIVEEIQKRGHEIGHHTHTHSLLINSEVMRSELLKSAKFIDKFRPRGFRAPQIHIDIESLKLLKDFGFIYSSSTYDIHKIKRVDGIIEIPVSSYQFYNKSSSSKLPKSMNFSLLKNKIPYGSGLFISSLGRGTSYFIDQSNRQKNPSVIFFILGSF